MTEVAFLRDEDWSVIDGVMCRVKEFTPMAGRVEGGRVVSSSKSMPYASIEFECAALPEDALGFITHKMDFLHVWSAFSEPGVGDDKEVLITWTKSHITGLKRLTPRLLPKLWVAVCPKEAFELMTDGNFRPELTGMARYEAERPIAKWMPPGM
jgi:hypothetical protein